MKANHIPQAERLRRRISDMECRLHACWQNGRKGNPYQKCRHCGIHTPQLSIDGRHFQGCPMHGYDKQIAHFKGLLKSALTS